MNIGMNILIDIYMNIQMRKMNFFMNNKMISFILFVQKLSHCFIYQFFCSLDNSIVHQVNLFKQLILNSNNNKLELGSAQSQLVILLAVKMPFSQYLYINTILVRKLNLNVNSWPKLIGQSGIQIEQFCIFPPIKFFFKLSHHFHIVFLGSVLPQYVVLCIDVCVRV